MKIWPEWNYTLVERPSCDGEFQVMCKSEECIAHYDGYGFYNKKEQYLDAHCWREIKPSVKIYGKVNPKEMEK